MARMSAGPMLFLVSLFAPGVDPVQSQARDPGCYFAIGVVDDHTGRRVPMAKLQTTSGILRSTDSADQVVFHEPRLMCRLDLFGVSAHGYEAPIGGLGIRGSSLRPVAVSYVDTFSGNSRPTPYYQYNRSMYRPGLSDPRLRLPQKSADERR
jgi:hypothetical protein